MSFKNPILVLVLLSLLLSLGMEYSSVPTLLADDPTRELPTPTESPETTRPAETPAPTPTTAVAGQTDPTPSAPELRMQIGRVDACGSTCRDVTAHLRNEGESDMTNVEVYTTIYAGEDIVWVDAERIGTVTAGDTHTVVKRVRVGPGEILKIHSNDGSVVVKTVVEFDQGSEVITERVSVF